MQNVLNNELFPKLAAIGLEDFAGLTLEYTNDDELAEQREREDKANLETANILLVLKNAGFTVSPEYVSERMGIDLKFLEQSVVPTEDSKQVSNEVMNKLNELYSHKH